MNNTSLAIQLPKFFFMPKCHAFCFRYDKFKWITHTATLSLELVDYFKKVAKFRKLSIFATFRGLFLCM
ncbi:MAG: hypothetical protein EAZ57_08615 [Cytophagales bacterium]|nr:MAG: hypothetical protein EAZ67_09425 [Cytophagales bacterium]TAF60088.1 MAG: hypothetical protein EAZ57_08615 [Cytophagales bacterium]